MTQTSADIQEHKNASPIRKEGTIGTPTVEDYSDLNIRTVIQHNQDRRQPLASLNIGGDISTLSHGDHVVVSTVRITSYAERWETMVFPFNLATGETDTESVLMWDCYNSTTSAWQGHTDIVAQWSAWNGQVWKRYLGA